MTARTIAPVAAAMVCAVVFGAIVAVGQVRAPAFASLQEQPDPGVPGTIAFTRRADEQSCVFSVPAGGGHERRLRCSYGWQTLLGWSPDGLVMVTEQFDSRSRTLELDPDTGRVVRYDLPSGYPVEQQVEDGPPWLTVGGDEGRVEIVEEAVSGRRRVLFAVAGVPRDYTFTAATWSPGRSWVLVTDSQQRLIIVDRDGGRARVLVEDARSPAWFTGDH